MFLLNNNITYDNKERGKTTRIQPVRNSITSYQIALKKKKNVRNSRTIRGKEGLIQNVQSILLSQEV